MERKARMDKLTFNYSKAKNFISPDEVGYLEGQIQLCHEALHNGTGAGSDFLGWLDLPKSYDKEEFARIEKAARKIQNDSEVFIVIGIGGSYLGSRAVIHALRHSFYNIVGKSVRKTPEIYFAGNSISSTYLCDLLDVIGDRDFSINIISKSGITTEPAVTFRVLKDKMERKYGRQGAKERIYATTDKEQGVLKRLCDEEGYQTFVIPDNVGGRFSVLTAVGLLPIAVSGADISALMQGAADGYDEYLSAHVNENICYQYAAVRNILYRKGKSIEMIINYEPSLHYFSEWFKQLFGESEGKDQKGIFPASADFSTDLHSMGQYIQDGQRILFETVLCVENPRHDITIKSDPENVDDLNFLADSTVNFVNRKAFEGTILAHTDGGVPNFVIGIPRLNEYNMGKLIYFFEKSCGISGYLLGVNPFDQPGVEAYKKNMFALLGKPGFESEKDALLARLED